MIINILGIDTGTQNTGCIILQGDLTTKTVRLLDWKMIRTTKKDGTVRERIDRITDKIALYVKENSIDYIVLEDFTEQGIRTGTTHKEMAWLTEAIRSLGAKLNIPTFVFENKDWKKKTLGIYRANKKQVKHYIHWKLPESKHLLKKCPNHVFDAAGIGYALWTDIV